MNWNRKPWNTANSIKLRQVKNNRFISAKDRGYYINLQIHAAQQKVKNNDS